MTRRILARWFTGCLLAVASASAARAQMQDAFVEPMAHDMQLFAPVDFDFEGLPIHEESGWFFNYSRLNWAPSGERATIGQPGATDLAEEVFRLNPLDEPSNEFAGGIPDPYVIENGIQDGGPDANFGWGNRYEVGFFQGGNGWLVGVLDGPKSTTQKVYGFPELVIPNTLPFQQGLPGPGFGNPTVPVGTTPGVVNPNVLVYNNPVLNGSGDITAPQNGFGSVHVNFETPEGFLYGWRDYWDSEFDVDGAEDIGQSPTLQGPGLVYTQITVGANGQVTAVTIRRGADGLADNIDGDLIAGFAVIVGVDINGDEVVLGTITDYGDLHRYNVRFDQLSTRNTTETQGVEIMRTHELDNSHMPVKEQRNHFSIAYGARFLRLEDKFWWQGLGDLFGRSYTDTQVENQIVGPQIRAKWTHQRGRFGFDLDGRFVAGYNVQDINQEGGIGENLRPGGLNSLLHGQPTYFARGQQENFFSPLTEMRVEGSYQLTSAFALKLGYTAMHMDNISRASQIVRYRLPDMGIRQDQVGKQDIFINGVDFGIEAVY
jgi:hypothetical protein